MTAIPYRIRQQIKSPLKGGLAVIALTLMTVSAAFYPNFASSLTAPVAGVEIFQGVHASLPVTVNGDGVTLSGGFTQWKLVKGEPGRAYLTLEVKAPASAHDAVSRVPVDMVVVLDRSGSMGSAEKLPYAKSAIQELVGRMGEQDRFALVSFDDGVIVHSPLVEVTAEKRQELHRIVAELSPGGSTNISIGLEKASEILKASGSSRSHRVILLSDGEANAGITDPRGLGQMAARISKDAAILSTVGMGTGFNENLMSSLADFGQGNYAWLNSLEKLGTIFAKDLSEARELFASSTSIQFNVQPGVALLDAGGYPVSQSGNVISISTGQLIGGATKQLTLTLQFPTDKVGKFSLGDLNFNFSGKGKEGQVAFPKERLALEIVAPELKHEALASIDSTLYRDTWNENNYGLMQRKVNAALKAGDKDKAKQSLDEYRGQLDEAGRQSGMVAASPKTKEKLDLLSQEVDDAFTGSQRAEKQNILAKKVYSESLSSQRK